MEDNELTRIISCLHKNGYEYQSVDNTINYSASGYMDAIFGKTTSTDNDNHINVRIEFDPSVVDYKHDYENNDNKHNKNAATKFIKDVYNDLTMRDRINVNKVVTAKNIPYGVRDIIHEFVTKRGGKTKKQRVIKKRRTLRKV